MASTTSGDALPSGGRIFTSFPDIFFIPEFVFGGLVWILVASAKVDPANPLGWDAGYHFVAVVFFLSASVDLAYVTYGIGQGVKLAQVLALLPAELLKIYRLYISAVVMSYVATLLYFLHAIFSAIRWKRS
ncbi:myelin and lymphocyte protein-like isoform X2 [Astatotilapia calliptera]|uniref:myelin and lymphocyte protein-like isoform X2 n=1 Tax=Astatotilapia calliptera TaxID=8154 RepID=UPI000E403CD0|nr:myelin and lymphocyte protein-like isoform X2 [Astatotilapia calliptera]